MNELTDDKIIEILVMTVLYLTDTEEDENNKQVEASLLLSYDRGIDLWEAFDSSVKAELVNHAKEALNQLNSETTKG